MSDQDHIRKLIRENERRLQKLKEQKARFGSETSPQILIEIEDIEAELEELQVQLSDLKPTNESGYSHTQSKPIQDSGRSSSPLSFRNIIAGIIITVIGGGILASILRFFPPSINTPTVLAPVTNTLPLVITPATNTPDSTQVPVNTFTPTSTPTDIPSPTSTPRHTSTSTPLPCSYGREPFKALWEENKENLGCPKDTKFGPYAWQRFENGDVFWSDPLDLFIIAKDDKSWIQAFEEDIPDPGSNCPPEGEYLKGAMRRLSCSQQGEDLGDSKLIEQNGAIAFQDFDKGFIWVNERRSENFIFFDNGTYVGP